LVNFLLLFFLSVAKGATAVSAQGGTMALTIFWLTSMVEVAVVADTIAVSINAVDVVVMVKHCW